MRLTNRKPAKVYLVGAGPGDPDLITVRGLRALQGADVVVHDRLVAAALLSEAPAHAEVIDVGKKGGHYAFPQERINKLLVERARRGQQVVRLKGGDPCLFGRGGEEAVELVRMGIPFEIVPGVTSAIAAPAAAGIPVTYRGMASSVGFVTGHQAAEEGDGEVNWAALSEAVDTLVVLMPLLNLRRIVSRLVLAGKPLSTPAAVISNGTRPGQRSVSATLGTIARMTEQARLESPALLIIGEVTQFAETLGPASLQEPASEGLSSRVPSRWRDSETGA